MFSRANVLLLKTTKENIKIESLLISYITYKLLSNYITNKITTQNLPLVYE